MVFFHIVFFFCLFMSLYVYIGYPLLALIVSLVRNRAVKKADHLSSVSILIAAYNEEDHIGATIENKLKLGYRKDKMEIIVVSDGSTDRTDEIVRRYASEGVKLLRQEPRAGKTSALNMAVPYSNGELLVFSDANSMYEPDALGKLVQNFNDQTVGYVTGKMIYTDPDDSTVGDGCGAYMKYENALRSIETKLGSVVGVDGGIDAVRKALYKPMNPDQLPDFVLPLRVVEQGYRVVYEPGAILKEPSLSTRKDEYGMRVRVALRALWAIYEMRHLLNPKGNWLFAWQLWSHKLFRYLCFFFMSGLYIGSMFLWNLSIFYKTLFLVQNLVYIGASLSPMLEKRGYRFLYAFNYFVLLNGAAAHAFMKFLMGDKQVIWAPRKG